MIAEIFPSQLSGQIQAPTSKSAMQRALAAALIRNGKSVLFNPGRSNDDLAALDIIRILGADVNDLSDRYFVHSKGIGQFTDRHLKEIYCGESGLSIRMFTPIIALNKFPTVINGHGSLLNRPMSFFDRYLPMLGVQVHSNQTRVPLNIHGPLMPLDIEVDGSASSQYITGLLMAYSASLAQGVRIFTKDLTSRPYVDLTLHIMSHFGLKVPINEGYESFYFDNSPFTATSEKIHYQVEGDWSGTAFLLVAGAIAGDIEVSGLDISSTQADKAILTALHLAKADLTIGVNSIHIKLSDLQAFEFDATHCPDLFPPLAVLAACCEGTTLIRGVHRLTHKESNRGLSIQDSLGKMGISVTLDGNHMLIEGGKRIQGAEVNSHHDHRIAMACAVLALRAEGPVMIHDADAVNKSYPNFYNDLVKLGGDVAIQE